MFLYYIGSKNHQFNFYCNKIRLFIYFDYLPISKRFSHFHTPYRFTYI